MTAAVDALAVALLTGSGIVAGVLFAVALSVLPALRALPVDRYVEAHRLLGRNWDPTMPTIVLTSFTLAAVLAVLRPGPARPLLVAGAVLLLGVSAVSHLANVPINRRVKAIDDATALPPGWVDPRPVWRRWHMLRTALAVSALVVNAAALVAV